MCFRIPGGERGRDTVGVGCQRPCGTDTATWDPQVPSLLPPKLGCCCQKPPEVRF